MATDSSISISNKQFSNYFVFYHELVPEGQLLSGSRAREFFLLSNLPLETLSHIWKLSDVDGDGQLNPVEFAVALHLTQLCLGGITLSHSLPSELCSFVLKVTRPAEYISAAKNNQVLKCQSAFLSFCENVSNYGYLTAEAARYLLTNSQLSKALLFHIWKLSDADKDGRLSFQEFVVAMHLIFVAKLDQPLPAHLNNIELFPEEFNSIAKKVSALVAEKPSNEQITSPPLVPSFVIPTDNPYINPVFKSIPSERFLNGKFDSFTGNPFVNTPMNGSITTSRGSSTSGHDEESAFNPIPHSESTEIVKHTSSRHSSVKSLVEERDEPKMLQAQSVDVESPPPSPPPPPPRRFSERESPPPPLPPRSMDADSPPPPQAGNVGFPPYRPPPRFVREESPPPPLPPRSESPPPPLPLQSESPPPPPTRSYSPPPPLPPQSESPPPPPLPTRSYSPPPPLPPQSESPPPPPPPPTRSDSPPPPVPPPPQSTSLTDTTATTESEDEEEIDEEKTKAELDQISKLSQKFLAETGSTPPTQRKPYKDPYANAPEMKDASQKGLTAVISEISPESPTKKATPTADNAPKSPPQSQTDTKQNGSQASLDFLAQLEDLEAEIMNVLDDTNSFDPMAVTTPPEPPSPAPVLPVVKPPKPPTSFNETDSGSSPKANTLPSPSRRAASLSQNGRPSPIFLGGGGERKGSAPSSSSSSSEPSPSARRFTVASSPIRKKVQNTNRNSAILDDLDDIFSAELASIDSFLESKQSREKKAEERKKKESMDLKIIEKKAMETPELPRLTVQSIEELKKKREEESALKQQEWEEEMRQIEEEARKQYEEQKKMKLSDEDAIKELDAQWEALLEQESRNMKDAWVIRAQRKKEEEERREEMKKKMLAEKREMVTIEDWIKLMEENKMKEMSPEERDKYMKRKKEWLEYRRQKEEEERKAMEEKLQRNREQMANEYMRLRSSEEEVRRNRLDSDSLRELEEEQLKREAVERKQRSESAKQRKEESKIREIEENKPKARSAIAARWEQQVKGRSPKDSKHTVLTGSPIKETTSGAREADRLARRVGKLN